MKDKELRKLIGSRAKQRRLELNLTQPYVAEKMGVTASTILRYENGSIDNTKKMVLEGLSEALHVSIEWLKGETDEYETDITDKKELQIRDVMGDILKQLPLDLNKTEDAFSKDLLLLMLKQYELFLDSFQFACKNYKGSTKDADIAKVMGFESKDEYNEIMFLREITHTVNAFNDMADVVRLYSKKPEAAEQRLANLYSRRPRTSSPARPTSLPSHRPPAPAGATCLDALAHATVLGEHPPQLLKQPHRFAFLDLLSARARSRCSALALRSVSPICAAVTRGASARPCTSARRAGPETKSGTMRQAVARNSSAAERITGCSNCPRACPPPGGTAVGPCSPTRRCSTSRRRGISRSSRWAWPGNARARPPSWARPRTGGTP